MSELKEFTDAGDENTSGAEIAFEHTLTQALAPFEVPTGFAERVLGRAEIGREPSSLRTVPRAKVLSFRAWRLVGGGAIAAALLAGSFALETVRVHHQRDRERAAATQQFETATRITDQALAQTREQLQRAGALGD